MLRDGKKRTDGRTDEQFGGKFGGRKRQGEKRTDGKKGSLAGGVLRESQSASHLWVPMIFNGFAKAKRILAINFFPRGGRNHNKPVIK